MGCGTSFRKVDTSATEGSSWTHEQTVTPARSFAAVPTLVRKSLEASVAQSYHILLTTINSGHGEPVHTQVILGCDFSTAIPDTAVQEAYDLLIELMLSHIKPMQEAPEVHAYGFGDLHTQSHHVFCFQENDRACCNAQECVSRLSEIRKHVTVWGPLSFVPIIWQALKLVRVSRRHHTLLLLVHSDHDAGLKKKTLSALRTASTYPLSIIIVGIGELTWNVTSKLHRKNCKFIKFDRSQQQHLDVEVLQTRFVKTAMKGHAANYHEAKRRNMIGDVWKAPNLEEVITVCSPPDRSLEGDPWYGLPSGWDAYWDAEKDLTVYVDRATKKQSLIPPSVSSSSHTLGKTSWGIPGTPGSSGRRARRAAAGCGTSSTSSTATIDKNDPFGLNAGHQTTEAMTLTTVMSQIESQNVPSLTETCELKVAAQGSPPQMAIQKDEASFCQMPSAQSATSSTAVVETKTEILSIPANHSQDVSYLYVGDNDDAELSKETQRDQRGEENPNGSVTDRLLLPIGTKRENDLQKEGEQLQADIGLKTAEGSETAEKRDGKLTWHEWVALDIRKGDYIGMHLEGFDQFTLHRLCAGVEGSEGVPFVEDVIAQARRHRKQSEQVAYERLDRETSAIGSTTTIGSKIILWI